MKTLLLVSIIVAIGIGIVLAALGIWHYRDAYIQNCEAEGGSMTGFLRCTVVIEDFATEISNETRLKLVGFIGAAFLILLTSIYDFL